LKNFLRTNHKRSIKHAELNIRCKIPRSYQISELEAEYTRIGLIKINNELSLHGHPKMREKMSVINQRKELLDHYKHYHNQ